MKSMLFCLPIISIFIGCSIVQAQTPPSSAPQDASIIANYQVAPQDVLSVTVVNFPTLSSAQAVVTADGTVTLPLLNQVMVAGKTTTQISQMLETKWKRYVIRPSVTVSLLEEHHQTVYVSGFVAHPGEVDFRQGMRLLDAVTAAGDALTTGDLSQTTLDSSSGAKVTYDLTHPETKHGTASDPILSPDDSIFVPELRTEFSVIGQVHQPGSFPYKTDMTVLDAITTVGGTLDSANLNEASLIHNGQQTPLNLDAMINHGDMSQNVKLAAGDQILVPEGNRVYLYGAVQRPGYCYIKQGDRVLDALNSVGGPVKQTTETRYSTTTDVKLVRINKVNSTSTVQSLNLDKVFRTGDLANNPVLQAGDIIYIPDKHKPFELSDLFSAYPALQIFNLTAQIANKGLGH